MTEEQIIRWMRVLGGLALFMFGMQQGGQNLQRVAGSRFRRMVSHVTDNRIMGVGVGAALTFLTNSSSATSVFLVGLAGVGAITLSQAMGVLMGAGIGTTITVQVIAFKLTRWALALVAGGFLLAWVGRRPAMRLTGNLVFAFGLIFFGMEIMSDAVRPLGNNLNGDVMLEGLRAMNGRVVLPLVVGLAVTAVFQSSGATIGILIALSAQRSLDLTAATAFVLGANVGTTITAFLAALPAGREGKQVAVAQFLYKVTGVLVCLPFLDEFARLVHYLSSVEAWKAGFPAEASVLPATARAIANGHMLFNLATTVVMLPLIPLLVRVSARLSPSKVQVEKFKPLHLDTSYLDTPELALDAARREILHMGQICRDMVGKIMRVFRTNDLNLQREVLLQERQVDLLERETIRYLSAISQREIGQEQSERVVYLFNVMDELENMGDVITRNLMELAAKKAEEGLRFSTDGMEELAGFHAQVQENIEEAVRCFQEDNAEAGQALRDRGKEIKVVETRLRRRHIERLSRGLAESLATSTIHLDVLYNLRRLNDHAMNIAWAVGGKEGRPGQRTGG